LYNNKNNNLHNKMVDTKYKVVIDFRTLRDIMKYHEDIKTQGIEITGKFLRNILTHKKIKMLLILQLQNL
jgi:hypothetical protein